MKSRKIFPTRRVRIKRTHKKKIQSTIWKTMKNSKIEFNTHRTANSNSNDRHRPLNSDEERTSGKYSNFPNSLIPLRRPTGTERAKKSREKSRKEKKSQTFQINRFCRPRMNPFNWMLIGESHCSCRAHTRPFLLRRKWRKKGNWIFFSSFFLHFVRASEIVLSTHVTHDDDVANRE